MKKTVCVIICYCLVVVGLSQQGTIQIQTSPASRCDTSDGKATVTVTGLPQIFEYSLDGKPFTTNNSFSSLSPGSHGISIRVNSAVYSALCSACTTCGTTQSFNIDCSSTLPLKLLEFNGERVESSSIKLLWETVNEINSSGFWIERSLGNTAIFSSVAFIKSKGGNFLERYDYTETNNYEGASFYRLRQVDLDGHFNISKIISIKGILSNKTIVFPNPNSGTFTIIIPGRANKPVSVELIGMDGSHVFSKTLIPYQGRLEVRVDGLLSSGIYIIKLTSADVVSYEQIRIVH
jgi:hypothetical protein